MSRDDDERPAAAAVVVYRLAGRPEGNHWSRGAYSGPPGPTEDKTNETVRIKRDDERNREGGGHGNGETKVRFRVGLEMTRSDRHALEIFLVRLALRPLICS